MQYYVVSLAQYYNIVGVNRYDDSYTAWNIHATDSV